jgi:hypothetical protein
MVVSIGFALMIVLAGLGRGIEQTKDRTGVFSMKTQGGFKFKMPDWTKSQNSPEARKRKREEDLWAYKKRMHRALHPEPKDER